MVLKKIEHVYPHYKHPKWNCGSIIDFETIGLINNDIENMYKDVEPFILGLYELYSGTLTQYYVKEKFIDKDHLKHIIKTLKEPFYAFSSEFERSIILNMTGINVEIRELQTPYNITKTYYEKKQVTCNKLLIENYDDPYYGDGSMCIDDFINKDIERCLAHNRACLLKERDILYARGYYESEF